MKHTDLQLKMQDGETLYAQAWEPEGELRGVLCLVHGLGEHSGRYTHVAQALAEAGYALLGFDLRGHGRSPGKRGHIPSYQTLLGDIDQVQQEAGRRFPGKPRFLYGHSMGGNLVITHALRCPPTVRGVIATSPIFDVTKPPPKLKLMLGKILYKVAPTTTLPSGLYLDGLCRDTRVVEAYKADPLVHGQVSAQLALDMLNAGKWALEHASEFPVPLLLIHGEDDLLTSFPLSEQFARAAPASTTFHKWPGGYHELHNDFEQKQLFKMFVDWLDNLVDQP